MIQVVIDEQQPALNVYENIICLSFQNMNEADEIHQDTFVKISDQQDLTIHCACIAQILSRHPSLREVLDVAITMSYNNDKQQN